MKKLVLGALGALALMSTPVLAENIKLELWSRPIRPDRFAREMWSRRPSG